MGNKGCKQIPEVSPLHEVSGSGDEVPVAHALLFVFPQALMTVGRIEKLFMSQRQWERGDVGLHCSDKNERRRLFEKQQFVLQFYLGFLKINPVSREHHFSS